MRSQLSRILPGAIVAAAAVALLVSCGGQPAAAPAPAPAKPPATTPAPAPADSAALRANGQELFRTKACIACHGADGKGTPNVAPPNRGKSADDIRRALGGDAMRSISLTEGEIQALAAYLQYLQTQP